MARRKKKKWFSFKSGKKKTKAQLQRRNSAILFSLKILLMLIIIAAIAVGLYFLDENYVHGKTGLNEKWVKMNLVNSPDWMSNDLKRMIFETAGDGNGWFRLGSDTAESVYNNLRSVAWLNNLKVKIDPNSIKVFSDYYTPALLIESSSRKAYVASDRGIEQDKFNAVVLSYVPIYDLPIPVLKGVNTRYMPEPGLVWQQEDVRAGIELINVLKLMDKNMLLSATAKHRNFTPLLAEVGAIDVANFGGRKDKKKPHIIIYSTDGTPIYWGSMQGNLEAVRVEKLGKLYQCYKDFGTLQLKSKGLVKYIDLRTPEKINPIP